MIAKTAALNTKLKKYGGSKSLKCEERNGSERHNSEKMVARNCKLRLRRNDEDKYAPIWRVATTRSTEGV